MPGAGEVAVLLGDGLAPGGEKVAQEYDCGSTGTWRSTAPACSKSRITEMYPPAVSGWDRFLSTTDGVGPVRLTAE